MRRLIGWPDPRKVVISAAIGLLLGAYAWIALLPILSTTTPRADDFQDYKFAAQQIVTGGDPYANFIRTRVPWDWSLNSGYIYPPAFAATLVPLTLIPNDLAVRIWLIAIELAVVLSLLIIYRSIGPPSRAELLALVAVLVTFFPLINSAMTGTMNALILLLLTAAWAAWRSRKDAACGVLTAVAAVFKLFPLALIPYLAWRRHWRLLATMMVTGVAGIVAGFLVAGLAHNLYYYREILPHISAGTGFRENQSIAGVTARLCAPSTAENGGSAGWCGRLLDWPLVLALLAGVVTATNRATRSGLEFALAVATLPLISTVTWSFHLVILILPIALLVRRVFTGQASRVATRLLVAAWLCFSVGPAFHYLLIVHPFPHWPGATDLVLRALSWLFAQTYFVGTVIIAASLWVAIRAERVHQAAPELAAAAA